MKITKMAQAFLVAIILNGCADLAEVRDFASQSAQLSAYTDLTTHFRDTYKRQQPYLWGEADKFAQTNDKKRQASYADLLKLHNSVVLYMQTLAKLAGEDTFNVSTNIDKLAGGINSHAELGINAKEVDAVSDISKIITKWAMTSYQDEAVREMITEGDSSLQIVLSAMQTIVRSYKGVHNNEKKYVLNDFLANQIALHSQQVPSDQLLLALARADQQKKTTEYQSIEPEYDLLNKGIASIAKGHKNLLENVNNLSSDEIKSQIKVIAQDIKIIVASINDIKNNQAN